MKIGQDKQRKGQKMQILEKLNKKKCKRVSVALALAVMMPMTAIASPLGMLNAVTTSDTMQFASLLALAAVSLIITLVVRKHRFEA